MATKPKNRFLKIAGMTAGIATKAAAGKLKNLGASEEQKQAAHAKLLEEVGVKIADTLGEMKGAVMKVGQIASQYKEIFPPEVAKQLEKLQRAAPPMPFATIKQQVEKELDAPIDKLFASFEHEAFAAASIGQVHRATLPTGEKVVVKVQYPGVDESCESDLKQVRMALKLIGLIKIDKDAQEAIFAEMRDTLFDELDYTKEAHNLTVFKTFHTPLDQGLIIPDVYPSHSSRRVLTLSEEMGESLATASNFPDEVKTRIAKRLFHFSASQLYHLRRIHCDPHPGNFAFRDNGDVVVYDFGGTRSYSEQEVDTFRLTVRHALKGDITALEQDLVALGIRTADGKLIPSEFYEEWVELFTRSLRAEFDFASSDIHKETVKLLKKSLKYWDSFTPSPTTMMVDRTISGQYWNLVNLGAKVDLSEALHRYIDLQSTS